MLSLQSLLLATYVLFQLDPPKCIGRQTFNVITKENTINKTINDRMLVEQLLLHYFEILFVLILIHLGSF